MQRLTEVRVRISLSRPGRPSDNPFMESFFWTVKREEVYLNEYQSLEEARNQLAQFLEADGTYNATRLHSSLDYVPPLEFEAAHASSPA